MISLTKLTDEIAKEYSDCNGKTSISGRTLRRKFEEFISFCGGDYDELKTGKGRINFQDEEIPFIKTILHQLADEEGLVVEFLKKNFNSEEMRISELDTFIHDFIQEQIYELEDAEYKVEEIKEITKIFDILFDYTPRVQRWHCHQLIDCIALNNSIYPMTYRVIALNKLLDLLSKENVRATIEGALYVQGLADVLHDAHDLCDDPQMIYGEYDSVAEEYMQRDRKFYELVQSDENLRSFVENRTGLKAEELFRHLNLPNRKV